MYDQTKMRKWVAAKVEKGENLLDVARAYINNHDIAVRAEYSDGATLVELLDPDGGTICSGAAEGSGPHAVEEFLRMIFFIPEEKSREKITAEQMHYLTAYCTPEEIDATMRKRGVSDIKDLPRDYADRLILRIAEKRMKRQ